MALIRPATLVIATALAAPALWSAATGDLDVTSALTRFLIAVPVAAVMIMVLSMLTESYRRAAAARAVEAALAATAADADAAAATGPTGLGSSPAAQRGGPAPSGT